MKNVNYINADRLPVFNKLFSVPQIGKPIYQTSICFLFSPLFIT